MPSVKQCCELELAADKVWDFVADFGAFARMLADSSNGKVETAGIGPGMTRTIKFDDNLMVERLERIDTVGRELSYSIIVPGAFPVSDYRASIAVKPLGDNRCTLEWEASFLPLNVSEDAAAEAVNNLFSMGISLLEQRFSKEGYYAKK